MYMFKKLQRKILLLNMALISVVMLSAFAAVYVTTWQGTRSENLSRLDNQAPSAVSYVFEVTDNPAESIDILNDPESHFSIYDGSSGMMSIRSAMVSTDYALSFSVEIDADGSILSIDSIIDMPQVSYEEAVRKALAGGKEDGTITLENKDWMYRVGYLPVSTTFGPASSSFHGGRQIFFLDVTESKLTLRNLLMTLSTAGIAVLIVFYIISLYFSKRAVKPVIEAWEKQKMFIADASHELKTPLTIISANCDALLESGHETVESQRKWVDYIRDGADRMTRLTVQLLTLAKMDDRTNSITPENVDMSRLVTDGISSMEAIANKRGLTITQDTPPNVFLKSEGEKVSTVINVLLENAVKYADSRIDVMLKKESRRVVFTVSNDGMGIKQEDLPRVFDRFYKGDKSREGSGSYGLGLSIAKTVTQSLSGKISVESEAGGSTLFTVILPDLG